MWCRVRRRLDARRIRDLQVEMAKMKFNHSVELWLNEWYDMREPWLRAKQSDA